jgi:hypothetical protein
MTEPSDFLTVIRAHSRRLAKLIRTDGAVGTTTRPSISICSTGRPVTWQTFTGCCAICFTDGIVRSCAARSPTVNAYGMFAGLRTPTRRPATCRHCWTCPAAGWRWTWRAWTGLPVFPRG